MADFSQSRSIHVDAPASLVHPLIDDFREWTRWSPWEDIDPGMQRIHSGAERGVGSRYAWKGNSKVGEGNMQISRSEPQLIQIGLRFLKPFKATNVTTFTLTPAGGGTDVTWTMSGKRNPVMDLLGKLYFDKAIAKDFDRGLARLKTAAEA